MVIIPSKPDIAILEQDTCLTKLAFNVFRNILSLVQKKNQLVTELVTSEPRSVFCNCHLLMCIIYFLSKINIFISFCEEEDFVTFLSASIFTGRSWNLSCNFS